MGREDGRALRRRQQAAANKYVYYINKESHKSTCGSTGLAGVAGVALSVHYIIELCVFVFVYVRVK